jgi:prepilin-type N-terminal cleavage/methylation domain-containing protein
MFSAMVNSFGQRGLDKKGFTLVELIVVISIVSGLVLFSLPVFRNMDLSSVSQAGKIARLADELKTRAVEQDRDLILHVETGTGRIWVSDDAMDEQALDQAREKGVVLSEDIDIFDVEFPGIRESGEGEYRIRFRKQGYSDFALIHLTDKGEKITIRVEPFLSRVELLDDHVFLEDCI